MSNKVIYPAWLHFTEMSLMDIPKPYQEFFIRWYYYDNSEDSEIPDTVPVENIEDYIVEHMNGQTLWCAKGFASARNVSVGSSAKGDNMEFKNDAEFLMVVHYVARLWYKTAIEHDWIDGFISKEDFKKECHIIRYGGSTAIHI